MYCISNYIDILLGLKEFKRSWLHCVGPTKNKSADPNRSYSFGLKCHGKLLVKRKFYYNTPKIISACKIKSDRRFIIEFILIAFNKKIATS